MLVLDCFFGRCRKPSCDGCLFKVVRSLRLTLKSRAMDKCVSRYRGDMDESRRSYASACCSESFATRFGSVIRNGTKTAFKETQKEAACPERRYPMVSRDQSRSLQRVRRLQGALQTRSFRTRSARSRRHPAPQARRGPPL